MMQEKKLPEGWVLAKLDKCLITIETGSRPKGGVANIAEGIVSIGGEHLTYHNEFKKTNIRYVPISFVEKMNSGHIQYGDILIVKDGATTGKTCFVDEDFPFEKAVVNEHVFIARTAKHIINPKYVFWYLWSAFGQNAIKSQITGSAQGGINQTFTSNVVLPIPPLPDQYRIAETLDQLFGYLREARAALDEVPGLVRQFRQKVLAMAVRGELTREWRKAHVNFLFELSVSEKFIPDDSFGEMHGLPNSWKWVALGNYANCSRGRFSVRPRNDPSYYGGPYPFIQIGDLPREGGEVEGHKQTLNEAGLSISKKFSKNTIAFAIVGATIGNTGLLPYEMCFPDSVVGINTTFYEGNLYLEYYFRLIKNNIREKSYASGGQPNLKLELINSIPIPLPPAAEQKEIVKRIRHFFDVADTLESDYESARDHLETLPQAILARAFSGRITEPVPGAEPAAALLERVKAMKAALGEGKKRKKATVLQAQ